MTWKVAQGLALTNTSTGGANVAAAERDRDLPLKGGGGKGMLSVPNECKRVGSHFLLRCWFLRGRVLPVHLASSGSDNAVKINASNGGGEGGSPDLACGALGQPKPPPLVRTNPNLVPPPPRPQRGG
uniref:Uncharacterized protein n=1 Tax=Eutreptiella gymnastica TaxID=73025 RepID=A0A7S1JD15_9EUGL|mmetsp:Transcript_86634/g.150841  ORF Transcript_86634/g.150841 Transcript_86634/m.150841 type:complete len:127 (+) Transcript_86634:300-680(+)